MRRFFTAPEAVQGEYIEFDADLAHHMGKVLRLAPGEQVTVCTGDGMVYVAELESFRKDSVTAKILETLENQKETEVEIVLYQGMPKGDKLELIIQKCTELGVSAVIPVETGRSIVHLDSKKAEKKIERWQKIAHEASQQSKRVQVPEIGPYLSWKQCLNQLKADEGLTIIFWEDEQTQSLKALLKSQEKKTEIIEPAEVGRRVFEHNPGMQQSYMEEITKASLPKETAVDRDYAVRTNKSHKIKTDTGIELIVPSDFFNNTDYIEFVSNDDGTISINIKKVGQIINGSSR